jgi:tRNA (guanosine-2'-O-)-methyltransferase
MVGMAQSLNVSVAAAIILFEAKRQREKAKMYDVMQLNKQEYEKIYNKWIKRDALLKRIKGKMSR